MPRKNKSEAVLLPLSTHSLSQKTPGELRFVSWGPAVVLWLQLIEPKLNRCSVETRLFESGFLGRLDVGDTIRGFPTGTEW